MNQQTVDSIVEYCRGARLIVIDTLSRAHSLDENKNGEMAQLMSQMDSITKSTGASVLFVHHISKGSAKEDAGNQASASRGASVLVDNSRFVCYLQSINKNHPEFTSIQESERWRYIQHGVSKVNYSSRPKEMWLEKGHGGVLAYSLINKVNRGFESTPIVVDDMTPPEMKPPVPFVVPTPDEPMVTQKAEEEDGNVPDFFAAPKFEMKGINGERIDF